MTATTVEELQNKRCRPCEGGVDACSRDEADRQLEQLAGWSLAPDGNSIRKSWRMKDFAAGIRLLNGIAEIAEQEGHHPDLHLEGYRNVRVELTTHAIGGLSENDFIMAAKIGRLQEGDT